MPTEESRIRNIEKVLDSALYCFKKYGIEGTKMSMVSKHSGVSVRSITRYFSTKENLVLKCMEKHLDYIKQAIEKQLVINNANDKSGLEQLQIFLESWRMTFIRDPQFYIFLTDVDMFFYKNKMNSELVSRYISNEFANKNIVKLYINNGIKDGSINPNTDVNAITDFIFSALSGFMRRVVLMKYLSPTVGDDYIEQQLSTYIRKIVEYLK